MSVRCVLASVVAAAALTVAGGPAWGHTFPPVRTVVLQIERCEVALLVGYQAGSKQAAETVVARVASLPKSQAHDAMRDVLAAHAMAPLSLVVDGSPLVPASVHAKIGVEGEGGRAMVVLLLTYPLPRGKRLALSSKDSRTTRISWVDRSSSRLLPGLGSRVSISEAPVQGRWFSGVASFLLNLDPGSGGSACAAASPSSAR